MASDTAAGSDKVWLQSVIDSLPGFFAAADSQGRWIEKNAQFEPIQNQQVLLAEKERFLKSGKKLQIVDLEWSHTSPLGQTCDVAYSVRFEKISGPKEALLITGTPRDELREAIKQMENQRSKAEYAARLATLGEMAGGVAHEINNPLAVILGHSTQLLREMAKDDPDKDKMISKADKITKTVARIARIVQGLRTFSRQGEGEPMSPTPINGIIEETLELCHARFHQAGVHLDVKPCPEVEIRGRSVQISQVMMNLLNNAFDAVKTEPTKLVKMDCVVENEILRIKIEDSGPGVDEQIVKKIFEPFFTTKEVGHGTGLGLSISKNIMLEHGGDLLVSKFKSPTTFEIRIPVLKKP